jgi:hypothetical protein
MKRISAFRVRVFLRGSPERNAFSSFSIVDCLSRLPVWHDICDVNQLEAIMLKRNTAPTTPDILTVQHVADRLQVSTTWVIRNLGGPVTTRNKRR